MPSSSRERRGAPPPPAIALVERLHEVGHHLGVGLGDEAVARGGQARLERQVVLDDPVVDDHDLARGSPGAGGRSPRWAGRGWPSACARCRRRPPSGSARRLSSRLQSLPTERRRCSAPFAHHRHARRSRSRGTPAGAAPRRSPGPRPAPRRSRRCRTCRVSPSGALRDRRRRASRGRFAARLLPRPAAQPALTTWRARPRASAPGGHVLGDGAARADVGALAHRDRRHQRGVAADEGAGLDAGGVLVGAVVVAGDGAGPDVDARAHRGVADVGEVRRLGARRPGASS